VKTTDAVFSQGIAGALPTATARAMFAHSWQIVRRGLRSLLAALALLWLVWFVPWLLVGVLRIGAMWNAGPARPTIVGLIVAVVLTQLAALGWLILGLARLFIEGARERARAPFGFVFVAARQLGWLLLMVALVATVIGAEVLLYLSPHSSVVDAALPLLVILTLTALATQSLVVPLIVDRRLNTFAAMAAGARLLVARGRFTHLTVVGTAAAGTLLIVAAFVWQAVVDGDVYFGVHSVLGMIISPLLIVAAIAATVGVAGCAIAVPLVTALYLGLRETGFVESDPAPPPSRTATAKTNAPRLRRPLIALAIAAFTVVGLAWGASWLFSGVDSSTALHPGQRITLRSGLSLVVPKGRPLKLIELRQYPSWLPIGQNAATSDIYLHHAGILGRKQTVWFDSGANTRLLEFDSCYSEDAWMFHRAAEYPIFAHSVDGSVVIRSKPGSRLAFVVTHLPGRMPGLLWVEFRQRASDTQPWNARQLNAALAKLWRDMQIKGAQLPGIAQ
jgi:hypothetical protein